MVNFYSELRLSLTIILIYAYSTGVFGAIYATKATANGPWTTSSNWSTTYPGCCTLTGPGAGHTYNIFGKITIGTISTSQTLTVDKGLLNIEDTLIIYGNLVIGNNGNLSLTNGSVLIVYGNVTIDNQVTIAANSYFVIMGNFTKTGSAAQGSFTSDDQPSNVYIGGTVTVPAGWADDGPTDVFNCAVAQHDSSNCNWGNPIDLQDSPIADIVNSNCTDIPVITSISVADATVEAGSTINFSSSGTTLASNLPLRYNWSGPQNFSITAQNPSRTNAQLTMTGYYLLTLFNARGCASKDSVYVEILCVANGGTIAESQPVCLGDAADAFTSVSAASPGTFTYQWYSSTNSSDPAAGTWNTITGETGLTYSPGTLSETTNFYRKATETGGCNGNSNVLTIIIYNPVATGNLYILPNNLKP